jgi:hypothetical protein
MFLHFWAAFGGSVDGGDAAKSSAMEIVQYGATGFRALKNADDENAIGFLPPKSHIQPYRIWLGNIDAFV